MATTATNPKQQAHELIDRMSTGQVSAVVGLLKPCSIPSPSPWPTPPSTTSRSAKKRPARSPRLAPPSHAERVVSNEEVLAEFGLTAEDFERMGRTPLEPEPHHPGQ